MNSLITVSNGLIEVDQKMLDLLEKKMELQKQMDAINDEIKAFDQGLLQAMEDSGAKWFSWNKGRYTYVPATTRKTVDTAAMKADGVYDFYVKEVPVRATLRFTANKEDGMSPYDKIESF